MAFCLAGMMMLFSLDTLLTGGYRFDVVFMFNLASVLQDCAEVAHLPLSCRGWVIDSWTDCKMSGWCFAAMVLHHKVCRVANISSWTWKNQWGCLLTRSRGVITSTVDVCGWISKTRPALRTSAAKLFSPEMMRPATTSCIPVKNLLSDQAVARLDSVMVRASPVTQGGQQFEPWPNCTK